MREVTKETKPLFPHLSNLLNLAAEEVEFLNSSIVPYMDKSAKYHNYTFRECHVFEAAQNKAFFPSLTKKELQFKKFIHYNGQRMYFSQAEFMNWYNSTKEGTERLSKLREFEQSSFVKNNNTVIQR